MREGSLEAPTRHPIDWKNPEFFDEGSLFAELERVYDICHGCRRCVSLCNAFPTLFDLVDNNETMEVEGVAKADYWKVVDQCYLCDLCYMTKCPYVPPHEWNLDFPHLMLRAKAVKFRKGEVTFRDKLLSSTDTLGKLASIPVVVQIVNKVNRTAATRKLMDDVLHIHRDRELPEYDSAKFRSTAKPDASFPVKAGANTPGKVAIFSTCYVNYNEPGIGHDLIAILAQRDSARRRREGELLRHAQARAGRSRRRREAEERQHPRDGEAGPRGLRDRHGGAVLHADVQAGAAAHVPG
jgi:glycerol-3-phosphate dehydrogenase subunit C